MALSEQHREREPENAILKNIRRFPVEMGGYYAFVGNQYRLEADGQEYLMNLLRYHGKLHCLIAIEWSMPWEDFSSCPHFSSPKRFAGHRGYIKTV